MNTLYLQPRQRDGLFVSDKTGEASITEAASNVIDYMYIAPEDCSVYYVNKDNKPVKYIAKKGDIIIKTYISNDYNSRIIIIKNKELKDVYIDIETAKKKAESDKEGWAKKNSSSCCDCDCCSCC